VNIWYQQADKARRRTKMSDSSMTRRKKDICSIQPLRRRSRFKLVKRKRGKTKVVVLGFSNIIRNEFSLRN